MRSVIFTLAKKIFSTGIGLKTRVSAASLFAVVIFLASFLLLYMSYVQDLRFDSHLSEQKIVVINAPTSFYSFIDGPDRSFYAFVDSPAIYDFIFINRTIHEQSAVAAIAFPSGFETQILEDGETSLPDVLTYISPDLADGKSAEGLTALVLNSYSDYLNQEKGVELQGEPYRIAMDSTTLTKVSDGSNAVVSTSARMVMPLLLIIMMTYAAMTSGVNSISGEKEKGTFYGLMLAPITHQELVLGHFLGVFGRTILPALLFMPFVSLIHYRIGPGGILITMFVCILFAWMITSITIMFSIVGRNILSAQTAFLPVFLIILVVCVMSMQSTGTLDPIYKQVPFFGHYHAMTDALLGGTQAVDLLILTISSICISVLFAAISIRLLRFEAFTVTYDSESKSTAAAFRRASRERELAQRMPAGNIVFGYRPKRLRQIGKTLSRNFWIPLALLSFFQTLSLFGPVLLFIQQEDSSQIIIDTVNTLRDAPVEQLSSSIRAMLSALMSQPLFLISMAISYVLIICSYMLIVTGIEKNKLSTLGFPTKGSIPSFHVRKAISSYGRGLLLGLSMILSVYLILFASGQIRPIGIRLQTSEIGLFLAYILMWIPQGAAEEVMMRGYMLPRTAARFGVPAGIFLSSAFFSLLHIANAGFTFLAFLNLMLLAAFFAILSLMTQEIYTVCAVHTAWNFAQGNILGMNVSGGVGSAAILDTRVSASAVDLWTGGSFGPEGGLAVTVIAVTAIAALCVYWKYVRGRHPTVKITGSSHV